MAKVNNILIYQQVVEGKRTFRVPATDMPAIRQGLRRRGYLCRVKTSGDKQVTFEVNV